jgi:pimeloyl-ACP methyl ester carboxylesterase
MNSQMTNIQRKGYGVVMIDRRTLSKALLAGAAMSVMGSSAKAQSSRIMARNVVLVHGAYADASSWSEVIGPLQRAGLHVTAVQNPLTSLKESVAATRRALAMQDGPTVLAAHSWGGMVISEVGVDPKVSALVYVAARGPDAGEDFTALAKQFPPAPAGAGLVEADGFAQLNEKASTRPTRGFYILCKRRSPPHCFRAKRRRLGGGPNHPGTPSRRRIGLSIPSWSGFSRGA